MVRSRPDHPAMWSFPHLLVTNSPRKKMERKKNTLQFSQLFGLKTVSCISEKQRQQFHKNATQPAKQQGHFNNLAAMSPAKPVSPAPSSTTPMAAKAAQRCHSEAGEPPSFASADTRRPDTCGESLWDPDIFDQKMPHTEDCPMRIPPILSIGHIRGNIQKKCLEWENWLELWMLRGFCSRRNCILETKMETEVILSNETMKNNKKRQQRQFSITQLAIFSFIFRGKVFCWRLTSCSHRSKACQNHGGIPCNAARASAGLRGTQSGVACLAHEVLRTLQQLKA